MSGSGAEKGFDYQARAFAYLAAHALAGQPLPWFSDDPEAPVPAAILMETSGPGDDIQVELRDGSAIEVQAKHRLQRGDDFDAAMLSLVKGLAEDEALRCVLLVDTETSRPIRVDLREDIKRLGQGRDDNLHDVTHEVLEMLRCEALQAQELDIECLFRRLQVVELNLHEGGDGHSAAQALLSTVVASPDQASTAWRLLCEEGHGLTRDHGRRDVAQLQSLLSRHCDLAELQIARFAAAQHYREWAAQAYGSFFVPALDIRLPISEAWDRVERLDDEASEVGLGGEALEEQIHRYHERARLLQRDQAEPKLAAEDVLHSSKRMVVVGGPGSGKSTLANRLVYSICSGGGLAALVKLKSLGGLLAHGHSFDHALAEATADGSDLSLEQREELLSACQVLVADGLDECDPNRQEAADGLRMWAEARSDCTVCVMTRPVGHSPQLLPGFCHVELLPLSQTAAQQVTKTLFANFLGEEDWEAAYSRFASTALADEAKGETAAPLFCRNPLLLVFAVWLFINEGDVPANRGDLYERIIDLFRRVVPQGRGRKLIEEPPQALQALASIGFLLVDRPAATIDQVLSHVAAMLQGQDGLSAYEAEECARHLVRFWEQQRLLERLTAGPLQTFTFVHPSLGEYAAAQHIAAMNDDKLSKWLVECCRRPGWREPIVMAGSTGDAERLVSDLLQLDDLSDVTSSEALLAADILAEVPGVAEEFRQQVVQQLRLRLKSDNPLVAVEAGLAISQLAPLAPELVGNLARQLLDHEQRWTRLAALSAALSAGPEFVTVDEARDWLDTFELVTPTFSVFAGPPLGELPSEASELQHTILPLAVRKLLQEGDETTDASLRHFLTDANMSLRMMADVQTTLDHAGRSDLVEILRARWAFYPDIDYDAHRAKDEASLRVLLQAILAAAGGERQPGTERDRRPRGVAGLLSALQVHDAAVSDWYVLGQDVDREAVIEVLRAAIVACSFDTSELIEDANHLLDRLDQGDYWSIWRLIPNIPVEPGWRRGWTADLHAKAIVRGLTHPSPIVSGTAARLIWASEVSPVTALALERLLWTARGDVLRLIALLASRVWGSDAPDVLIARVSNEPVACMGRVLKPLVRCISTQAQVSRTSSLLADLILATDPELAQEAVEALSELPLGIRLAMAEDLRQAVAEWSQRTYKCKWCGSLVEQGRCTGCHAVPPDPYSKLVAELVHMEALTKEELLRFLHDDRRDVRSAALEGLAKLGQHDKTAMTALLKQVPESEADTEALGRLLELDADTLRPFAEELRELMKSPIPRVRSRLVSALPAGWLDEATALNSAERALDDEDPTVRSAAARAVRTLRGASPSARA